MSSKTFILFLLIFGICQIIRTSIELYRPNPVFSISEYPSWTVFDEDTIEKIEDKQGIKIQLIGPHYED